MSRIKTAFFIKNLSQKLDIYGEAGIIAVVLRGVWLGVVVRPLQSLLCRDGIIFFHPAERSVSTAASSLFRPRRLTQVSDGVFYLTLGTPQLRMSSAIWKLEGTLARLIGAGIDTSAVDASIDTLHPERGISLRLAGASGGGTTQTVLGVVSGKQPTWEASQVDAYVRQNDLVATYAGPSNHPLRLQIYWRWIAPAELAPEFAAAVIAAFDLIVSVNTSLLDDDPQSKVHSIFRSGCELAASPESDGNGAFLIRCANADASWLEMVHPSDFCHSEVKRADQIGKSIGSSSPAEIGGLEIAHELFRQRLEKGVILRARVRGALISRRDDEAICLAAYRRFAAAEPPLTV